MLRLAPALLAAGAAADRMTAMYKELEEKGLLSERSKKPFHFKEVKTETVPHVHYGEVQKTRYRSPPINLMNGEAWFTLPTVNRMPMPKAKEFAIVNMVADIVTESGRRPPTSEMYGHHWLFYDTIGTGSGDNLGCGGKGTFVSNIFGAGAEMRGVDYNYPKGYGYYSTMGEKVWSANLHFINTIDLSTEHFKDAPDPKGAAMKACVECNYSPGNTGIACLPGMKGNFACCIDEGRCHTNNPSNKTKTTYYLQYDIYWSTDLTVVKPARTGVIDTFSCGNFGNIQAGKNTKDHTCDDKICTGHVERTVDIDGHMVWSYCHQHVGAINASLYHNGKYVCTSYPHYGTDPSNPIGNEQGYTTGFDLCMMADGTGGAKRKTLQLKKGDKLKVESVYNVEKVDPRILPMPADGFHGGVMGLFYFRVAIDGLAPTSPPSPGGQNYICTNAGTCAPSASGFDKATCEDTCKPPAGQLFQCTDGQCVVAATGVVKATCELAC